MLNQELTERYEHSQVELHFAFLNYHVRRAFRDIVRLARRDGRDEETALGWAVNLIKLVQARCHVNSKERVAVFGRYRYLQALLQPDDARTVEMEDAVCAWHEHLAWFRKTMPRLREKLQTPDHIFDYVETLDDEQIGAILCKGLPPEITSLAPQIYADERVAAFAAVLPERLIEAQRMHRQHTELCRRMSRIQRHLQVVDPAVLDAPTAADLEQMGFLLGLFCLHNARMRDLADPIMFDDDAGVAQAASLIRRSLDFWQWRLDEICASQTELTEEVGGVVWHKVKRGAMRIYLRETAEGVLFHLIQRRDWEKPCLVERKFAHA